MKKIFLILPIAVLMIIATSCAELLTFADDVVGSFHTGLSDKVYDHTYTTAWLSGTTGGRILGASGLALGIVDAFTEKDLSPYKDALKQGTVVFNGEEGYKTEKGSIIGVVATIGGAGITLYEDKVSQEKAQKYDAMRRAEMEAMGMDDCAMEIDAIKDPAERYRAYEDCKKKRYRGELEEILEREFRLTLNEYDSLSWSDKISINREIYNLNHKRKSETWGESVSADPSKIAGTFPQNKDYPIDNFTAEDAPEIIVGNPKRGEVQSVENTKDVLLVSMVRECGVGGYPFNGIELSGESKQELEQLYDILAKNMDLHIKITGHTCNVGSEAANFKVGLARAEKWKEYLVDKGINPDRILLDSKGATQPIVENTSSENREKNRRIEIDVLLSSEEEENIRIQVDRLMQFYSAPRTFRVQIMATSTPIKDYISYFVMECDIYGPMEEEVGYVDGQAVYRYVSNEVRSWEEAKALKDEFAEHGFKAWIVEYRGGTRVPL